MPSDGIYLTIVLEPSHHNITLPPSKMPEIDSTEIGGLHCGIHEHELGTGAARSNSCADCEYSNWAPTDHKFVIEHDSYGALVSNLCYHERIRR
mmetsp:Transcript_6602/g.11768  ORF Transcript_6602/g.11768 Transcript_6602/m.11768 type:complete len:94 (+) Transcript_6602:10-291(+)